MLDVRYEILDERLRFALTKDEGQVEFEIELELEFETEL